jgi:hypothetical protein
MPAKTGQKCPKVLILLTLFCSKRDLFPRLLTYFTGLIQFASAGARAEGGLPSNLVQFLGGFGVLLVYTIWAPSRLKLAVLGVVLPMQSFGLTRRSCFSPRRSCFSPRRSCCGFGGSYGAALSDPPQGRC